MKEAFAGFGAGIDLYWPPLQHQPVAVPYQQAPTRGDFGRSEDSRLGNQIEQVGRPPTEQLGKLGALDASPLPNGQISQDPTIRRMPSRRKIHRIELREERVPFPQVGPVLRVYNVPASSMAPNFPERSYIAVNLAAYGYSRASFDWIRLPVEGRILRIDRKSTRLNSSHVALSRMPSSA